MIKGIKEKIRSMRRELNNENRISESKKIINIKNSVNKWNSRLDMAEEKSTNEKIYLRRINIEK